MYEIGNEPSNEPISWPHLKTILGAVEILLAAHVEENEKEEP